MMFRKYWFRVRVAIAKLLLGPHIMIGWKIGQGDGGDVLLIIADTHRFAVTDNHFALDYIGPIVPWVESDHE